MLQEQSKFAHDWKLTNPFNASKQASVDRGGSDIADITARQAVQHAAERKTAYEEQHDAEVGDQAVADYRRSLVKKGAAVVAATGTLLGAGVAVNHQFSGDRVFHQGNPNVTTHKTQLPELHPDTSQHVVTIDPTKLHK